MGINRDLALEECQPAAELPFSHEEFQHRLQRIRAQMECDGISFMIDELKSEGWMSSGTIGMDFHSYRPNPAISQRFRDAFESTGMSVTDGSDILRDVRWN